MRITVSDFYGHEYSVTVDNESTAPELQEVFDRLLVQMGFPNDICCSDGGHYELKYVGEEVENEL